jgi:chorismate synthase
LILAGNSFGTLFKVTTFGESHGKAIGVLVDGVRPGLSLTEADLQVDLDRRRPGASKVSSHRKESDQAEILSGVFEEKTTGAPVAILIKNEDARSQDYNEIKNVFRPGHADYGFVAKFQTRDWRGGGRSSGRETAARVAAGAIAKKMLKEQGISVIGYSIEIGGIKAQTFDLSLIDQNLVRCPDPIAAEEMIKKIDEARSACDSVGGIIEVLVKGCPAGLGDPVFDKLDARLAQAMISIGSIKGIEFGDGFKASVMKGSEFNDSFVLADGTPALSTNHCGGILGGISVGSDIVLRAVVRPTSSIAQCQDTITEKGQSTKIQIKGRHDPCICPRAIVVAEAMTAMTILDSFLIQKSIKL